MGKTLDLGQRIELCSMDPQFHDISMGLYCRQVDGESQILVHSYSQQAGTGDRVEFIRQALIAMAGLTEVPNEKWLRFPCGSFHKRAIKRSFLDLCKLATGSELPIKPMRGFDKKAKCDLLIRGLGQGRYECQSAETTETSEKRSRALAVGFAKVCEMSLDEEGNHVSFACQSEHDSLLGLMFFRAQNVRRAMREEEQAASRGVLAPPSQQE